MENSSLSNRPTSEEDDVVFCDSGSRREQSSHDRELPAHAQRERVPGFAPGCVQARLIGVSASQLWAW